MLLDRTRPAPRVLVVDPNPVTRESLRQSLEGSGVDAAGAAGATDALESVSTTPPHAVLLTLDLPDADGHHLCRVLRERPDTHRTPIIGLVSPVWADVQRALDAGCDVALVKQSRPAYLLRELHRVRPSHFHVVE